MKLSKKLIPAIGMLMLSAVMLVTSSFAWFSMNDKVTATGMTVTAKGDQIYLQIIKVEDPEHPENAVFTDGAAQTSATAQTATGELKPTAVKSKDGAVYGDYQADKDFYWVTAFGKTADDGTLKGAYEEVTTLGDKHYLKNTFKIRLDETAGAVLAPGALRVAGVNFVGAAEDGTATVDALGTSVSVFVVCGDNSQLYMQAAADGKFTKVTKSSDHLDANGENKFNNKEGVIVDVYVFFNGDDADCKLSNLVGATNDYSVEVHFTVE